MTNNWYKNLNKSKYTPPNWVFSFVWSILYFLMFISFIIVWKDSKCYPYCIILTIFLIQLILNSLWTTIFFKYKKINVSLLLTIFLLFINVYIFKKFYLINKLAGYLLIPYLLWLLLAVYLNLYIVIHN